MDDCIFCAIGAGQTKTEIVFDGGDTVFFRDIHPKAPVHVIGIPKKHIVSLAEMTADDQAVVGKRMHEMAHVAEEAKIEQKGYRVITNVGQDAGQEIQHLHFHLIGGERLGPLNAAR